MKKFKDLYNISGEYISEDINISSTFNTYMIEFDSNHIENDGIVEILYSYTDNGIWTDWIKLSVDGDLGLIEKEYGNFVGEKIRFKYILDMSKELNGVSPVVNGFHVVLNRAMTIINNGHIKCKPELFINKISGSGDIEIENIMNGSKIGFKGLNNNETVYVDCENEDIETDLPKKYRYNDHLYDFIELDVGKNILVANGDFKLVLRHEYKLLQ